MFGYRDVSRPLGSRRSRRPLLLTDILPTVVEVLHEVYVARGGPPRLDAVLVFAGPPGTEETAPTSFSRAA